METVSGVSHLPPSLLRRAGRRWFLCAEPGPQTHQVGWQALLVADESFSFRRNRLGANACSSREAIERSGCRVRRRQNYSEAGGDG